jgi:hypothetical protein
MNKKGFLSTSAQDIDEEEVEESPPSQQEIERAMCFSGCTRGQLCMCDPEEENFMVTALHA